MGYLDGYLRQSTVHGFRYVVEGQNRLERTVWFITIAITFAMAIHMLAASLRDAEENPVATSIQTVPVQDIPFPAVSLSGVSVGHPNRLFQNVLNNFEFDCINKDEHCLKRTEKTRKDFAPFIKRAVRSIFHNTLEKVSISANIDKLGYVCSEEASELTPLAFGTMEAYDKADDSDKFVEVTIDFIAENLRHPWATFLQSFESEIQKHLPEFERNQNISSCGTRMFEEFSHKAQDFTFAMLVAMGYNDKVHEVTLGSLMTVDSDTESFFALGGDALTAQKALSDKLNSLLPLVKGNSSLFSASDLYQYMLPTVQGVPDNGETAFEKCIIEQELLGNCIQCPQFCEKDPESVCCKLEKEITAHPHTVMGLMKYALAPPSRMISEEAELAESKTFKDYLGYTQRSYSNYNRDPAILACKFGTELLTHNCDLFSKIFTTQGIGYSFNNMPFWVMYKNTSSNMAFYKNLHLTKIKPEYEGIRRIQSNGRFFALEFHIYHKDESNTISLSLQDPLVVPDLINDGTIVEQGMIYDISVTPSMTKTDEAGLSLSADKRGCVAGSEEKPLKVFNMYSQSSCLFECQLERVVEHCKCSPWDYPRLNESIPFCHSLRASNCFETIVVSVENLTSCDCPNDCNNLQYSMTPMVRPIPTEQLCTGSILRGILTSWGVPYLWPNEMFTMQLLEKGPQGQDWYQKICKDLMAKTTIVRVKVSPKMASKIVRTRRVTFSGYLANLGGLIGLFSGMSILSLAEMVFWILRTLKHYLGNRNQSGKQ